MFLSKSNRFCATDTDIHTDTVRDIHKSENGCRQSRLRVFIQSTCFSNSDDVSSSVRAALLCSVHRLIFYQDKHKITCITPFMLSSSVMRFKHLIRRFARHHNITYNQLSYAMHLNQNRLMANHIVSYCVRYSECMHYFNFIYVCCRT